MIGQVKKLIPQNYTLINRTNDGSTNPVFDQKAVNSLVKQATTVTAAANMRLIETNTTTAKANKEFLEQKLIATNHTKATSSCSIMIPGKRSLAEINGALSSRHINENVFPNHPNRTSDARPSSKNSIDEHQRATTLIPGKITSNKIHVKVSKEANMTTVNTDRRHNKGLLKSTKQDLVVECDDSTQDVSEGIRVERLKGKLKEITAGALLHGIKKPKNAATPDTGQPRQAFGGSKKSLIIMKEKLLSSGTHSQETLTGAKTIVSPLENITKKVSVKDDVFMIKTNSKNKDELCNSLTDRDLEGGQTMGIKTRMEITRLKLDVLKGRLKRVLKNCPKLIQTLKQKLIKIM